MASLCPDDLIRQNIELASLPEIVIRLNQAVDDPYSTAKDISDIISEDPALSARLLRIVNSPFYGFPSQIDTISLAVTIVGTQQLRLLALASSTIRQFANLPNQFVTMETFWRHSFSAAVVAARRKNCPLYEAERAIIGFDHAIVGSTLLRYWNIPETLVEAVACHHRLGDTGIAGKHKAIAHLANVVADSIHPGLLLYRQNLEPDPEARTWSPIPRRGSWWGWNPTASTRRWTTSKRRSTRPSPPSHCTASRSLQRGRCQPSPSFRVLLPNSP